jgi:sporulation protein YlmC with PRC-barrel domain
MIEQLRIGAHVLSSDGKQVGELARIVVTSDTPAVTHLVVDPGGRLSELLEPGSLDKPRDRLVPIDQARAITESEITLGCDAAAFAAMPLFERHEYIDAPVSATGSRFRLGELVNYLASAFGLGGAPYIPDTDAIAFNVSADSDVIPENAPVWRMTPHEEIGVVERTLADMASQRLTGVVIRRASIDDRLVIVPIASIASFDDGVAHVNLTDEELDHLTPYTPEEDE